MAIGTIILGRLMTPEEYGLYSIALIPSYMAILFRDWGVNSAITRYIAGLRAENKEEHAYEIVVSGMLFEAATGIVLSVILISLSIIASTVFQRPEISFLIIVAATTIFAGGPLLTAAQSSFIGFERMEFNSLTNICQAIVKTVASPLLVFVGYGCPGGNFGLYDFIYSRNHNRFGYTVLNND
jgi:O-antigen/teichoic acid export membrane protein